MKKRLESAYKTRMQTLAGKDPTLISAVDSSVYAQRFVNFMTDHIGSAMCAFGKLQEEMSKTKLFGRG
eukprot:CAMPEP_0205916696 /NCGR_PEP_ID=MMETSP1325-20131115/8681_1 /ASSEMBLY_ACC=CAM_ASM_000708 /TAXON_ID=236786 /ORGANISM="Florenciella sp., Strain RCC1007" /LENGTH=67 /DNA_ID=CAMNT_0053284011 /DNA_START=18 /DNA_END=219 /DNA_ORIENTATION=+